MKRHLTALIVLLCCITLPAAGQNRHRCDSLERFAGSIKDDSLLIHIYSELALENAQDSATAMGWCMKAKGLAQKSGIARWQCNAAMLCARIFIALRQQEPSEKYLKEALSLATSSGYTRGIGLYHTFSGMRMADKHTDDQHPLIEEHFRQGIAYAKKLGNTNDLARALLGRAAYYYRDNEKEQSLRDALEALRNSNEKDPILYGKVLNMVRQCYGAVGERNRSFEIALKYLQFCESQKDSNQIGYGNLYVANSLALIKNYSNAQRYYDKAIKLGELEHDLSLLATAYERYAVLMDGQKKYEEALEFHRKALDYQLQTDQKRPIPLILGNMGETYLSMLNFDSAVSCQQRALDLRQEMHITEGIMFSYKSFGEIYNAKKEYAKAMEYGKKALDIAISRNHHNYDTQIYDVLYTAAKGKGSYKDALQYLELFKQINDSVNDLANSSQIDQMKNNYETEKSERERELADRLKDEQQKAEKRREENFRNFIIIILVIVSSFSLWILRSYRQKQKDNKLLEEQKREIAHQKEIVEDKNKEIIDSIQYARRIQRSLLPTEKYIDRNLRKGLKKD